MDDIIQKKLKIVALKGILQEISAIRELLEQREEKAKAKFGELMTEIQQTGDKEK